MVDKNFLSKILEGQEEKQKTYSCIVHVGKKITREDVELINGVQELAVDQKTPVRVLHRRSLAVRRKVIHSMRVVKVVNGHYMHLNLTTQAGTYIKEFVHGDFGRTNPNLGSLLGCEADILQLDVLEVLMP